jgi:hypothetical protein
MGFSPLGVSLRRRSNSTATQQPSRGWLGSHVTVRQRMAMKSFHSEAVSGWQGSHPTARQQMAMESFSRRYSWHPANGKGAMPRQDSGRITRDSGVHQWPILVLTSDRACSGARKHQVSLPQHSESGTGWCGVSEVLGSSGVRAKPEEVIV